MDVSNAKDSHDGSWRATCIIRNWIWSHYFEAAAVAFGETARGVWPAPWSANLAQWTLSPARLHVSCETVQYGLPALALLLDRVGLFRVESFSN
jgi:hypothetical protein